MGAWAIKIILKGLTPNYPLLRERNRLEPTPCQGSIKRRATIPLGVFPLLLIGPKKAVPLLLIEPTMGVGSRHFNRLRGWKLCHIPLEAFAEEMKNKPRRFLMVEEKVPKYIERVLEKLNSRPIQPGVYEVKIRHDDSCRLLRGKGGCDCSPDIGFPLAIETETGKRGKK